MFDTNFEIFHADTEAGFSIHKQIRYRVFCLERGFEDPQAFENGEETDSWDANSAHFVVRDKKSGKWVATMRIIFADKAELPVETNGFLTEGFSEGISRSRIAEISRFCIVRKYAEDPQKEIANDIIGSVQGAEQFEITQGMLRAIGAYSQQRGVNHCYIMITPAMARMLRRIGVVIYQAGEATEYKGTRIAFLVDFSQTAIAMKKKSAKVKAFIERQQQAFYSHADFCNKQVQIAEAESTECVDCLKH